MNQELVTVIIPSHNRGHFIGRCYNSVAAQTHRPIEVVIVDDFSDDDTSNVVASLPRHEDLIVKYIRLPMNAGASAARNVAVRASRGETIAFLDSDDVWFPMHLEVLLKALTQPGVDVAYGRSEVRESPEADACIRADYGPTPHEIANLEATLYFSNSVLPSVTAVKRSCFERVGYFDEDRGIHEDWDIVMRAAELGITFAHVPMVTACYTRPSEESQDKQLMMLRRTVRTLDKHWRYSLTRHSNRVLCRGYHRLRLGVFLLREQKTEARKVFYQIFTFGWRSPQLLFASLTGIVSTFGRGKFRDAFQHALTLMMRRMRVRYLRLRGVSSCGYTAAKANCFRSRTGAGSPDSPG